MYFSDFGSSGPFAGGTLLVLPVTEVLRMRLGADGHGSLSWPIPNLSVLIGSSKYMQAVFHDSSLPGGFSLSNGSKRNFGP